MKRRNFLAAATFTTSILASAISRAASPIATETLSLKPINPFPVGNPGTATVELGAGVSELTTLKVHEEPLVTEIKLATRSCYRKDDVIVDISEMQTVSNSSEIDASARFSGFGIDINARVRDRDLREQNHKRRSMLIYLGELNQVRYTDGSATIDSKKLIGMMKGDRGADRAIELWGTHYVSELWCGNGLILKVELRDDSEQVKAEFLASLDGGFAVLKAGVSAETKSQLERLTKASSVSAQIVAGGLVEKTGSGRRTFVGWPEVFAFLADLKNGNVKMLDAPILAATKPLSDAILNVCPGELSSWVAAAKSREKSTTATLELHPAMFILERGNGDHNLAVTSANPTSWKVASTVRVESNTLLLSCEAVCNERGYDKSSGNGRRIWPVFAPPLGYEIVGLLIQGQRDETLQKELVWQPNAVDVFNTTPTGIGDPSVGFARCCVWCGEGDSLSNSTRVEFAFRPILVELRRK